MADTYSPATIRLIHALGGWLAARHREDGTDFEATVERYCAGMASRELIAAAASRRLEIGEEFGVKHG